MITTITIYLLPTLLVLIGIRKYRERSWGKCKNNVRLDKKVAIVTGANSGIGFEVARQLAARNAQVILACRDVEKAREAISRIKKVILNNPTLVPMELDLASLRSIKIFAENIKKNYSEINFLVNNAGVAFPKGKRVETKDGFEVHFGVNHLGHFYLTKLLLDTLKKTQSRIIIVTSSLLERAKLDLNDLNILQAGSSRDNLYATSKLANAYFCHELAKRTNSTSVNVFGVCPGWVYTRLFRHSIKWYHFFFIGPIAFIYMRSPKQGAETIMYCITEPGLVKESGLLYHDCKHFCSKTILFDQVSSELWEESERMIAKVVS